jgi:hypothetical protein
MIHEVLQYLLVRCPQIISKAFFVIYTFIMSIDLSINKVFHVCQNSHLSFKLVAEI